jgi:hypothetical protein
MYSGDLLQDPVLAVAVKDRKCTETPVLIPSAATGIKNQYLQNASQA